MRNSIDRYQSAEYSRTLSKKVFEGSAKVASQGYRPGGAPPYGFHRLMLDENREADRILQPGQRKAIQNGRVVLVPGEPAQVETVLEIFTLFAEKGFHERQIVGHLNGKGVPSPGGLTWSVATVRHILTDQQYVEAVVYNRTNQRLKEERKRNPWDKWIITPNAYKPIITPALFDKAQAVFESRKQRYLPENMLAKLRVLYEKYSVVTSQLIRADPHVSRPTGSARPFFMSLPDVRPVPIARETQHVWLFPSEKGSSWGTSTRTTVLAVGMWPIG